MSSLLYAFGRLAYRRRGRVVLVWLFVLGLAVTGAATLSQGTNDTFTIPGTESQQAIDRLQQTFPQASGASAQVVAVVPSGRVDAPTARASMARVAARLATLDQVGSVTSPVTSKGALTKTAQVSADGRAALITAQLTVPADEVTQQTRDALLTLASDASSPALTYTAGGAAFNGGAPGLSPTEVLGLLVAAGRPDPHLRVAAGRRDAVADRRDGGGHLPDRGPHRHRVHRHQLHRAVAGGHDRPGRGDRLHACSSSPATGTSWPPASTPRSPRGGPSPRRARPSSSPGSPS